MREEQQEETGGGVEEAAGDFPWREAVGEAGHPEFLVWREAEEGGLRQGLWMEEGEEGLLGFLWKVEVEAEPSCEQVPVVGRHEKVVEGGLQK